MKTLHLCIAFSVLMATQLNAQAPFLSEDFTSSLPASWIQSPAASWSLNPGFGASVNNCIFTQNMGSAADSSVIYTPALNLTGAANLTVTFKAAFVGNNFLPPNIALWHTTAGGRQFLARWGTGFSSNTTDTITNYGYDYQSPLDAQNVHWQTLSHTMAAVSGTAATSFVFVAELYNGGYVVIDSVVIKGEPAVVNGVTEISPGELLRIFPNPSGTKKIHVAGGAIKDLFIITSTGDRWPAAYTFIPGSDLEIDLSNLATGMYYLDAGLENKQRIRRKIIVE